MRQALQFVLLFSIIGVFIGLGEWMLSSGVDRTTVAFLFGAYNNMPMFYGPFGILGLFLLITGMKRLED
jgi:uncharacterized membrane protein